MLIGNGFTKVKWLPIFTEKLSQITLDSSALVDCFQKIITMDIVYESRSDLHQAYHSAVLFAMGKFQMIQD